MVSRQVEVIGLPVDVFASLEMDHIEKIKDALFPKKN
jgi:hypothetical protein